MERRGSLDGARGAAQQRPSREAPGKFHDIALR